MSEQQKYHFNIFYIAVLFMWPVIKSLYLNIDGADRISGILTIIAIIVNFKSLSIGPSAMKIWIIWVFYSIFNVLFKGYTQEYPFLWWSLVQLICPLVSMLVVYNSVLYKGDKFLRLLIFFYLFYVLLGIFSMDIGNDSGRVRNAMGNTYLNNAIFFMPFMLLYYKTHKISTSVLYFFIAVVFSIIVLTGERKGLAAFFIMIVGMLIARRFKKSSKIKISTMILVIIILALSAYGALYLFENTLAGARFNKQFLDTEYSDNLFLTLMGDRGFMYYFGFIIFLDNPLTGLGLTNFSNHFFNPMQLMLHTEYMVELTENGLIGSVLFIILYMGMIVRILKMYRSGKASYETFVLGSALLAVIEINFFAWTYSYRYYFMLFGLIFATYDSLKSKKLV